jgi:hypothetical protein
MDTDFDMSLIDEDIIDIYVKPAKDRHLNVEEEDSRRRLEDFDMS